MDGIAWAASAMVAARTRLEIATENLANVSSEGYRRISARGFLTALGVSIVRERAHERGAARAAGRTVVTPRTSNGVDAISEMIDVLAAERSFESAQKAVTAIDRARETAAQAARIA
jgi:flagellar basal body rod protein FlgG